MEANIGRVPAQWRMGSFRLNPGPYIEKLVNDHNPYLGLHHAASSKEMEQEEHEVLKEVVVFYAANDLGLIPD